MIVSCGEALVDLVPEPVVGGGPLNVAVAAARLGVPAAFVGCVSTDAHGQRIWDHLVSNEVDIGAVTRSDMPTARAVVEHVPELRFRLEGTGTADTLLEYVDLEALSSAGPHIVHGGTLGLFRGRTAETLADFVEHHTGLVSLDPNIRPQIIDDRPRWQHFHDRWLACTDIYKASEEDLAWIWPATDWESCAAELIASGVSAVVVTRGVQGLSIITASCATTVSAPAVMIADTVGAGDTVAAAVLAGICERDVVDRASLDRLDDGYWSEIGDLAVRAAAVTCARRGADPPHRVELPTKLD